MVGTCPYYLYEKKGVVFCEGATVKFPDRAARMEFKSSNCCSENFEYKKCAICKTLEEYYSRILTDELDVTKIPFYNRNDD